MSPWTVIFSKALHVLHTPYPGEQLDALRVSVRPERGDHMEVLAFYFPVVAPDSALLRLHWGTTVVPLRIGVRNRWKASGVLFEHRRRIDADGPQGGHEGGQQRHHEE